MDVREKLVEIVERASVRTLPKNTCHTNIVMLVNALIEEGVTVQEWISVTERLPEKEDTYLVYTERGSVYSSHFYAEMKFASGYVREASWSQRGKVKVTHWMPLPQPPKGE